MDSKQLEDIARSAADYVIKQTYRTPSSVVLGLNESMSEELVAVEFYQRRKNDALLHGDKLTAGLYDHIKQEESKHFKELRDRMVDLNNEIQRGLSDFIIRMDKIGNIQITHSRVNDFDVFLQSESDKDLIFDILKLSEKEDLEKGYALFINEFEPRAHIITEIGEAQFPVERGLIKDPPRGAEVRPGSIAEKYGMGVDSGNMTKLVQVEHLVSRKQYTGLYYPAWAHFRIIFDDGKMTPQLFKGDYKINKFYPDSERDAYLSKAQSVKPAERSSMPRVLDLYKIDEVIETISIGDDAERELMAVAPWAYKRDPNSDPTVIDKYNLSAIWHQLSDKTQEAIINSKEVQEMEAWWKELDKFIP
jgi:hypothetical protein